MGRCDGVGGWVDEATLHDLAGFPGQSIILIRD